MVLISKGVFIMSLKIYRSVDEVPSEIKVVNSNDSFFNVMTDLTNTELVCNILRTVDKAEFNSNQTFIGRTKELGALHKSMLSTGTKTLINIIQHPEFCFNVVECGNNVLQFIPKITEGHILWELPVAVCRDRPKCDIDYRGRHCAEFLEFLSQVEREERL